MQLSNKGLAIIQQFEGFRSAPYKDSVGIPTIGFGNTYYLDGRKVKMTDPAITREQASDLQLAIINRDFAPKINAVLKDKIADGTINQNMFDACVSLAYNIGINGFTSSSVVRNIKEGDKQKAADSFLLWNKASGKILQGLVNRRNAERKLFLT